MRENGSYFVQGHEILKSIEKEMDDCRERNDLLAALTLSLESVRPKTSKRMLQFSIELQEDLEQTLNKQRASLTTAQRLQRKIQEMLAVTIRSELLESYVVNPEAHAQKAQSDDTDGDSLITPKEGKSGASAASKPPIPLLEEALLNTVILGLSGPADEYQVRTFYSARLHFGLTNKYFDRLHGKNAVNTLVERHGYSPRQRKIRRMLYPV
jgi:hypothetical protein